jgi:hypothetical protein
MIQQVAVSVDLKLFGQQFRLSRTNALQVGNICIKYRLHERTNLHEIFSFEISHRRMKKFNGKAKCPPVRPVPVRPPE